MARFCKGRSSETPKRLTGLARPDYFVVKVDQSGALHLHTAEALHLGEATSLKSQSCLDCEGEVILSWHRRKPQPRSKVLSVLGNE